MPGMMCGIAHTNKKICAAKMYDAVHITQLWRELLMATRKRKAATKKSSKKKAATKKKAAPKRKASRRKRK